MNIRKVSQNLNSTQIQINVQEEVFSVVEDQNLLVEAANPLHSRNIEQVLVNLNPSQEAQDFLCESVRSFIYDNSLADLEKAIKEAIGDPNNIYFVIEKDAELSKVELSFLDLAYKSPALLFHLIDHPAINWTREADWLKVLQFSIYKYYKDNAKNPELKALILKLLEKGVNPNVWIDDSSNFFADEDNCKYCDVDYNPWARQSHYARYCSLYGGRTCFDMLILEDKYELDFDFLFEFIKKGANPFLKNAYNETAFYNVLLQSPTGERKLLAFYKKVMQHYEGRPVQMDWDAVSTRDTLSLMFLAIERDFCDLISFFLGQGARADLEITCKKPNLVFSYQRNRNGDIKLFRNNSDAALFFDSFTYALTLDKQGAFSILKNHCFNHNRTKNARN